MAENEPVGGLAQARSIVENMERNFPEQLRQAQESVRQSFEQGRAANSALMEFLNTQRGTGPSPLLQLASGLLRPTRAGGFGESLAAGAEGYAGALQQQRQGELDRAMRIQQLQAATANLGMQATQQQMALANQGLQFPATLATAYGNIADLGLLGGGAGGGTPTTRTQLAAPGGAGMPAPASPVGPQQQVVQTPLPAPAPAAPAPAPAPAPAVAPAAPANPEASPQVQAAVARATELQQRVRADPGNQELSAEFDRALAEIETAWSAASTAPAQGAAPLASPAAPAAPTPAPVPAPPAAAAAQAPAPAAAEPAATPPAAARSTDPMVVRAQGLLADAAANPERYAGPQGRALVERARTIVRESPEGQAEVTLFRERAERQVQNEDAANAANRRFAESTAEQQARSFQELAAGAGEATQALGRLQQLETVMRDLPSGVPGWFAQQAARVGLGPQATQYEVATALLKQLIPAQRQGMPGAVSDFDARNFEASLPRLMSSADGRRMVSDTLKSVAEYQVARGRIAMQAQSGEITRQEALRRFDQLPSPFDRFNEAQERFAAEQAQRRGAGGGALTPNADGSFNWSPGTR